VGRRDREDDDDRSRIIDKRCRESLVSPPQSRERKPKRNRLLTLSPEVKELWKFRRRRIKIIKQKSLLIDIVHIQKKEIPKAHQEKYLG
jgi:hypothetical protein